MREGLLIERINTVLILIAETSASDQAFVFHGNNPNSYLRTELVDHKLNILTSSSISVNFLNELKATIQNLTVYIDNYFASRNGNPNYTGVNSPIQTLQKCLIEFESFLDSIELELEY